MVDFPSNLLDPAAVFSFATSQSAGSWLALGINTILSTIIGGIVLIILVEMFSHKFGESIKPQNFNQPAIPTPVAGNSRIGNSRIETNDVATGSR